MDSGHKLRLLSDASRYDLSCACGSKDDDRRKRNLDGTWLYPFSLPSGGTSILLKTLMSSHCTNDCKYCPLRNNQDLRRCILEPYELADIFMGYVRKKGVHGLFLSSAVTRNPDYTMERMTAVAEILRMKHRYRGFLHLKVIPGASDAAIEKMVSLATYVSLNVEAPHEKAFSDLSKTKNFNNDIVRPVKLISRLTAKGSQYSKVKQTTQFIVGASEEKDSDIVQASWGLYKRLGLNRVYYSAYQRGLGEPDLPGEIRIEQKRGDGLTREHRLYQVDWLIRKYGFQADEIPFENNGNLSLDVDPKMMWAIRHPEFFPVNINRCDKHELLRIPGLGEITANRIINGRSKGGRVWSLANVGVKGKLAEKARGFICY